MKELNMSVLKVLQNGVENMEEDYEFIYSTVAKQTETRVNQFLDRKFPNVPLDRQYVISYCLWEHLQRVISSYDQSRGDFLPFYFSTLSKGILNGVQPQLTLRNSVNLQTTSCDADLNGEGVTLLDVLVAPETVAQLSEDMLELLDLFEEQKGTQAKQLMLVMAFLEGKEKTEAICQIFGTKEYTPMVRKKVERLKKDFASLLGGVK